MISINPPLSDRYGHDAFTCLPKKTTINFDEENLSILGTPLPFIVADQFRGKTIKSFMSEMQLRKNGFTLNTSCR